MTNLEYITSRCSENDIANILACAFGIVTEVKHRTGFSEEIACVITGFLVSRDNDYFDEYETRLVNVFLSLQYNEKDWNNWAIASKS